MQYFATREAGDGGPAARLDPAGLAAALAACGAGTKAFVWGPPAMIEAVAADLVAAGLPRDRVCFEKWW